MRHLLDPVQLPDLIQCFNTRGQASVHAEYLILDHSGQGQEVKKFSKDVPHIWVTVLAQALIVETIATLILR